MTPSEQGFVFSLLLKYREISTRPLNRAAWTDELKAARLLSDCGQATLADFDEFLGGQGLGLRILDGVTDLGIPPQGGRPLVYYILCRRFGEDVPAFIDRRAFINDFRDRRQERSSDAQDLNKNSSVFWTARLWLTLQYFFYDRIDRPAGNLYDWRKALLKESDFINQLKSDVEAMGNAGQPEGEAGLLWTDFWEKRASIATYARRFLKLMKQYRMIDTTDQEGVWCQTLVAAVDMSAIADRSLQYLMPAPIREVMTKTQSLINGFEENSAGEDNATYSHD